MRKAFSLLFFVAASLVAGAPAQGIPTPRFPQSPPATTVPPSDARPALRPEFEAARKLLQEGRFDEALAQLRALEARVPAAKGLSHELGLAYYKKGDYLTAIASLKRAQEENGQDGEATQLLGLSYYLAGKPAEAIPALEKVQTWYPSANVDASYILGICYIQTKDYPRARGAFAKMFDVPADSASSYLFTARMLLRQDFGPIAEE